MARVAAASRLVAGELGIQAGRAATLVGVIRIVDGSAGARAAAAAAAIVLLGVALGPLVIELLPHHDRSETLFGAAAAAAALLAAAAFQSGHDKLGVAAAALSQVACAGLLPEVTLTLARSVRSPRELAHALRGVALGGSAATALGGIGAAILTGHGSPWLVFVLIGIVSLAAAAALSETPRRVAPSLLPDALKRYPLARAAVVALAGCAAAASGLLVASLLSNRSTANLSALLLGGALGVLASTRISRHLLVVMYGSSIVVAIFAAVAASTELRPFALGMAGAALGIAEQSARALLRRASPPRAFGEVARGSDVVICAAAVIGVGAGSLRGGAAAFLLPALVLLVALVLTLPRIRRVAVATEPPLVELALLRSLSVFDGLPLPLAEGLAAGLARMRVPAGGLIVREGDAGDAYYAIATGEVAFSVAGRHLRTLGRGEGFGEIALLHDSPRTATAIAVADSELYVLSRSAFLTVLTGHDAAREAAVSVALARSSA